MPHLLSVLVPLAATPSPSPSHVGPPDDLVSPGWLGFVFLMFLAVAVFVIWKSLNTQLKKVRFDEDAVNGGPADAPSDAGAALTDDQGLAGPGEVPRS